MLKSLENSYHVSDKQKKDLQNFVFLIKKNQEKVNLIGKSTINKIWSRHVIDSLQIIKYLPDQNKNKFMLDVGTGAGFPGVVLSIMGIKNILLCEKSYKKAEFLRTVIKKTSLETVVYNCKVEEIFRDNIRIIVSRAYASIKNLIISVQHLLSNDTVLVIHKGKKYKEEINEAKKHFFFTFKKHTSITSSEGAILKIENIEKK